MNEYNETKIRFFKFLKKNHVFNLYKKYMITLNNVNKLSYLRYNDLFTLTFPTSTSIKQSAIVGAFSWGSTDEGWSFWNKLNIAWRKECEVK